MKKTLLLMVVAIVAVAAVAQPPRSAKRGVSENGFNHVEEIDALSPGAGWFYNWANLLNSYIADVVGPGTDMEFVPMIWSANFNEQALRNYLTEHPGVKYLLGYNEPNFRNQANMTPDSAARLWPIVEQIARDFDNRSLLNAVADASTPDELNRVMRASGTPEGPKSPTWVNAYKGAGAYFTMKNLILFHNCKVHLDNGQVLDTDASFNYLKEVNAQPSTTGNSLFAMMMKLISDNNFTWRG